MWQRPEAALEQMSTTRVRYTSKKTPDCRFPKPYNFQILQILNPIILKSYRAFHGNARVRDRASRHDKGRGYTSQHPEPLNPKILSPRPL